MSRRRNAIVIILFMSFLFFCGMTTLAKEPIEISFVENREMNQFVTPNMNNLIDGTFQTATDNAFQDQIIYRDSWMSLYKKSENVLKKVAYSWVNSDEMLLVGISNDVYRVGKDGEFLVEYPWLNDAEKDRLIEGRITNYNAIKNANEDLEIFIYKVTNARDESWFDEANEITAAGNHYRDWFTSKLDSRIQYSELTFDSWEQYQSQNYKTDHHWNMYGAYRGYSDIITLLNTKFELGNIKEPASSYCAAIPFYGSLVLKTNFNLDESIYDEICDFNYDLPKYSVTLNGQTVSDFGKRAEYKNAEYDTTKGVNHYREMFGKDSAEVIYDIKDNTGVNALFISDSYTNAIKPVLASHFDKAIFIDLRYFQEPFDLKEYVEKYQIDCVVYVGGFFTVFMDEPYIVNKYE